MTYRPATLFALVLLLASGMAAAADKFVEGTHYKRIAPVQQTQVPAGKVEVLEVFSYACPACNAFQPIIDKMRRVLPPNAQLAFLPASFNAAEDFPMFQRAYFTAQLLGVADRAHQGVFDAVWRTGELAISDPDTKRLKNPLPSIEDAARVYQRLTGVKTDQFLAMAKSFGVDSKMRAADAQFAAMQVDSTPSIVVNGKYRIERAALTSNDQLIELVQFLVAKESAH
jgi:protein dithiol oxidoreductase (disulfide-forming)